MIQVIHGIIGDCAVENTAERQQMEWQVMPGGMRTVLYSQSVPIAGAPPAVEGVVSRSRTNHCLNKNAIIIAF